MATVYKYPIPIEDEPRVRMPRGAIILTLQTQRGIPCMWALVPDPDAPMVERSFRLVGTGHEFRCDSLSMAYIGTFQMQDGALVFHLFEGAGQ